MARRKKSSLEKLSYRVERLQAELRLCTSFARTAGPATSEWFASQIEAASSQTIDAIINGAEQCAVELPDEVRAELEAMDK